MVPTLVASAYTRLELFFEKRFKRKYESTKRKSALKIYVPCGPSIIRDTARFSNPDGQAVMLWAGESP